jgi:hypothetical protein
VRQGEERVDDRVVAFGVPDQLLELVAPGVGALDRPASTGLDRGGLALFGDPAGLPRVASSWRVVRLS